MTQDLIAKSTITINAPAPKVWDALTDPKMIKQYFYGVDTVTDWKVGSPITYKGVWEGKPFEDKGKVLKNNPPHELVTTHWSPLSGKPDSPENYQTVTYTVTPHNGHTDLTITNDHNADEAGKAHSEQNWNGMLKSLKELLEK
jgi:uncharacterized protein YndB with AHSA1/START domain